MRIDRDWIAAVPKRRVREGWAKAFEAAGASKHDELLLDVAGQNDFDLMEWEW